MQPETVWKYMIYPGETVLNGAKFYSDREDTAMVYLDVGDNGR